MKKAILMIVSFSLLLLLSGCCLSHSWTDATCNTPKTCSKCEQTEGEPLEHAWKEATCQELKTCTGCGLTEGEKQPHDFGPEEMQTPNYVKATAAFTKTCVTCGFQSERIADLEKLTDHGTFLLTPEEFSQRFTNILTDLMLGKDMYFSFIDDEGKSDTLIMVMAQRTSGENHKILGKFKFTDINNKPLLPDQKNEANVFYKVQGTVTGEDEALFAKVALWMAGDPTNKLDDYRNVVLGYKALGAEIDPCFLPKSNHILSKVTRKNRTTYQIAINAK